MLELLFLWTWMYVLRLYICSLFLYSLWIIFVKKRDFNGRMQRIRKLNFSMTKVLFKRARMEILYGWIVLILDVKSILYGIQLWKQKKIPIIFRKFVYPKFIQISPIKMESISLEQRRHFITINSVTKGKSTPEV